MLFEVCFGFTPFRNFSKGFITNRLFSRSDLDRSNSIMKYTSGWRSIATQVYKLPWTWSLVMSSTLLRFSLFGHSPWSKESQNFAKLSEMRNFFPYLHDSLISKILVIIFQNVYCLVLKLIFHTKIVKQLPFVGKKACFGQKVVTFVRNKPKKWLKFNKIGLLSIDF